MEKTIHQVVKILLKENSQSTLAKIAGVSQMAISRWSRESPKLTNIGALRKLTKYLESTKRKL